MLIFPSSSYDHFRRFLFPCLSFLSTYCRGEVPVWFVIPEVGENSREIAARSQNFSHGGLLIWLPEMTPEGTVVRLRLGLAQGKLTAE